MPLNFSQLKEYSDLNGVDYGTEDFCIYLYSLVKMYKPQNIIELGTGNGTTSLWMGAALYENKKGVIHTVDNGEDWKSIQSNTNTSYSNYNLYINSIINKFSLNQHIKYYNTTSTNFINSILPNIPSVDIIFSDFDHGIQNSIILILDTFLKLSPISFIIIDSAPSNYPTYLFLEKLVESFNSGKLPTLFKHNIPSHLLKEFEYKVQSSTFKLNHIIENKDRKQNSTSIISITPYDIFPQPFLNVKNII